MEHEERKHHRSECGKEISENDESAMFCEKCVADKYDNIGDSDVLVDYYSSIL